MNADHSFPAQPLLRLFNPDAKPLYDAAMPAELTAREIVFAYLAHSEKKGTHGRAALSQRYQTLAGITLFVDRNTKAISKKKSGFPGLIDIVLSDGRTLGDWPVSALLPHQLEDWIENNPRWTSSSTRKSKANQVNACFNWARKGKRIAENPFEGIDYDEAEKRSPLPDQSLDQITTLSNKSFDELASYLRLVSRRVGEVCNLDWEHIDWQKATVRVTKFKGRKRLRKDQYYALVPEAIELLERIRRRIVGPATGAVFLNTRGRRCTPGNAGLYLRRLKKRHGVTEKATIHGIRHQAISEMIRKGGRLKAASLQAGHASTQITEKYYCHMEEAFDEMREAARLGTKKESVDTDDSK